MEHSDPPRRGDLGTRLERLGTLSDPVRRSLYEYVVGSRDPVTRDDVAGATGISRSLAAYHLDRLVDEGLLDSGFAKRVGGPGAGRPAKLYRRSAAEVAVSLPSRDDEVAARLLARAVEDAGVMQATHRPARDLGRQLGAEARERLGRRTSARAAVAVLRQVLTERGYEPYEAGDRLLLRNCPFDHLTGDHRDLVCGMNLALLEGLVDGLGLDRERAVLDPDPGRCCVALKTTP